MRSAAYCIQRMSLIDVIRKTQFLYQFEKRLQEITCWPKTPTDEDSPFCIPPTALNIDAVEGRPKPTEAHLGSKILDPIGNATGPYI
jgi:hypothetical protein